MTKLYFLPLIVTWFNVNKIVLWSKCNSYMLDKKQCDTSGNSCEITWSRVSIGFKISIFKCFCSVTFPPLGLNFPCIVFVKIKLPFVLCFMVGTHQQCWHVPTMFNTPTMFSSAMVSQNNTPVSLSNIQLCNKSL